jgi:hypothetical protein
VDEQISVKFTGDASGLNTASKQAETAFDNVAKASTKVSQSLSQSSAQIAKNAAVLGGSVKKGSNEAMQSLTNLSRVAQDAPYGFIGISNNLNPLLESFQRLKASTGTTGGALKALGGSLMGAGGIGLAVGVVSSLLVVFGDKLFGASKAASAHQEKLDALKKSFDELKAVTTSDILGGAGSEFTKAITAVETLRENVKLAKEGFIDKKEVVNQYNKELGDTIGKVKTLDEVEQALSSKADAYIKFTLLKAAAQQALGKASEAALKAAEEQSNIKETKSLAGFVDPKIVGNVAYSKFVGQLKAATKDNEKNVTEAEKQKDRFINIFKDFQDKAAEIAKDNHFKFNADIKVDTPKKGETAKSEFLYEFLPFNPNGTLKPEEKNSLLQSIDKFQKEFGSIIQGAIFTGTEDQRIQQAKTLDLQLKAGHITFDTAGFRDAFSKLNKDSDIIPQDALEGVSKEVIDQFIRGFQNESERGKGANLFGDLTKTFADQVDIFKTDVLKVGGQLPKLFEGKNIFGNKQLFSLDELFDRSKIDDKSAKEALGKAFEDISSTIDQGGKLINDAISSIQVEGLSTIGESIAAALTGSNIGDVFKAFEQTLGSAVESLGKQIIALNVAALLAKKALKLTFTNPAIGIAAGIALVAVGAALKALTSGGVKGFAKGGWVPGSGSGDTVPAMLTPGEYVLTKQEAPFWVSLKNMLGGGMKMPRISNGVMGFASGGLVPARAIDRNANFSSGSFVDVNVKMQGQVRGKDIVFVHAQTIKSQRRAT